MITSYVKHGLMQIELSPTRIPIKPVSIKHKKKKKRKSKEGKAGIDLSGGRAGPDIAENHQR